MIAVAWPLLVAGYGSGKHYMQTIAVSVLLSSISGFLGGAAGTFLMLSSHGVLSGWRLSDVQGTSLLGGIFGGLVTFPVSLVLSIVSKDSISRKWTLGLAGASFAIGGVFGPLVFFGLMPSGG
jgi:hypothetical protein